MAVEQCAHHHVAPEAQMVALPLYQGGPGRHLCAVCSYALGLAGTDIGNPSITCLHGKIAPESVINALPGPSQAGDARHRCVVCAFAGGVADRERTATALPDEISDDEQYPEGARRTVTINAFERNADARRRCLEHYGYDCAVCGVNLQDRYGDAGSGLIHVHHLTPIADIAAPYHVDPIRDRRPVCPTCHAVIHRADPPYTIEDVRAMLR